MANEKVPVKEKTRVFCPGCGEEIINVWAARSVELEKDGDNWLEKHVFSAGATCPHCHEELDQDTLEKLGLPPEWQ